MLKRQEMLKRVQHDVIFLDFGLVKKDVGYR